MKKTILLVLACLPFLPGFGQTDCTNGRYYEEIFPNIVLSSDLTYGSNYNLFGQNQSLELDIYEPAGDLLDLRPLIVWEHGGTFIAGDKANPDVVELAEPLTRMGYVNASIEYRLGIEDLFTLDGPDSGQASEAIFRAVADFKAAIRWFYKSARQGNPYRIDTNRIYLAGVSAGGIAAVHYAFLDDIAELPAFVDTTKQSMGGGLEGLSGNPGFPSRIQGVVSVSGMIGDTAWLEPGDEPLLSLHGTADDVVPYGTATISLLLWQIMEVDGSASIQAKADQLGLNHCLYTFPGAPHTPHVGNAAYRDTTLRVIRNFMAGLVCGQSGSCGYLVNRPSPAPGSGLQVFPQPCDGHLALRLPPGFRGKWNWQVTDLTGRTLLRGEMSGSSHELEVSALPAGAYLLRLENGREAFHTLFHRRTL